MRVVRGVFRNPELRRVELAFATFRSVVPAHPGTAVEAERVVGERLAAGQATIAQ